MITMVATGRARALSTARSYLHQELVILAVEAGDEASEDRLSCDAHLVPCAVLMKRAQNSGTSVIATRYEAASASTTPSANAMNR